MIPFGISGAVHISTIVEKTGLVADTIFGTDGAKKYYTITTSDHDYIKKNIPSSSVLAVTESLCSPSSTVNPCTKIV